MENLQKSKKENTGGPFIPKNIQHSGVCSDHTIDSMGVQ